ncbi:MAG: hypothetical protein KJP17_03065 [Gammaproteobacteria bacterium]|nr:hypothetical protein [Gammaproteobacteria bacterium]
MKRLMALVGCCLALTACKQVLEDANEPAIIVDPTDASRAALQQVVNEALRTDVLLADDALTDSSLLIIERKIPQSITGSPAHGRTMEMPVQFRLLTNGTICVLEDQRDKTRYLLDDTRCVAEGAP